MQTSTDCFFQATHKITQWNRRYDTVSGLETEDSCTYNISPDSESRSFHEMQSIGLPFGQIAWMATDVCDTGQELLYVARGKSYQKRRESNLCVCRNLRRHKDQ